MGYENPLHDGNYEKVPVEENVPPTAEERDKERVEKETRKRVAALEFERDALTSKSPAQESEDWGEDLGRDGNQKEDEQILTPAQTQRTAVVKLVTDILVESGRAGAFTARPPVKASEVVKIARFIIGDVEQDYPARWMVGQSSAEGFREYQQGFADKVATRQQAFQGAMRAMFERIAESVDAPSIDVPAADLKVGDVIAADGDVLTSAPVRNEETGMWSAEANCPTAGAFTFDFADEPQKVFGRDGVLFEKDGLAFEPYKESEPEG